MGLVEAAVPSKYRAKFTRAVARQRVMNAKGSKASLAEANSYYMAMNALPLWLQPLVKQRAK